ncbi:MAG: tRNA cyclic N6-threonylcarbamoyladenosine(37) synthase TcdA [Cellvibrionaceae bacterium]|nr:tRNA cyclic N6-threonylcarbamoyladenosine(37) synthase TcdA [Cellvibrionaceae bacterium]MCV6627664.1 tRNA cyclic N6-threonylcarbamoyladenosine(37) synthase TcdA [Cellvibrionaceae bacterium]
MSTQAYRQRFAGIARLYGEQALANLQRANIAVIGIGGVGSWVAEALARSGVGHLALVDMDDICISNTNRQLHTLQQTIGQPKIEAMAARLRGINPEIELALVDDFVELDNLDELVGPQYSVVVDAIDSAMVKAALIAHCRRQKQQVICVGSAGGKTDPSKIIWSDLSKTIKDPLLARVRKRLRQNYGFPRNTKRVFSVEAIYSPEQMRYPDGEGGVCFQKPGGEAGAGLDCSGGFGSATMVTSVFGMIAAARAIERYLERV